MAVDQTRRKLLGTLAAGAGLTVVGWSPASGWVTAAFADDTSGTTEAIPTLDGSLELSDKVKPVPTGFSSDFGHMVTGAPMAVLRPRSPQDIAKMISFARKRGLKIAMNGQSGPPDARESHSTNGQALVPGGIAIDARSMSTIKSISTTQAVVGAGVSWAEIVDAGAKVGATLPALTDFLHISVGGTLSLGGVGGTQHRFGLLADNVLSLTVVTGTGDVQTCSPSSNQRLFNAVLCGVGQCGIIVEATLRMIPVPTNALVFTLAYDDLATYMDDAVKVMKEARFSFQEGVLVPKPDGSPGWMFGMNVAAYYNAPNAPDQAKLLNGLRDIRPAAQIADLPYLTWVHRLDPVMAQLRSAGIWSLPHPWATLFVPQSKAADFMSVALQELTPADLGAGFAPFYPFPTGRICRPLFGLPQPAEPVAFMLNLLRFPTPDASIPALLAQNRRLFDAAVARGGKRYLIGSIPNMTAADWKNQFSPNWSAFVDLKKRYDPDNVLTPGQHIF